jgi:hypothetical protein
LRRDNDGQIGEPLRVENGLAEQSSQAHLPEGIYITRTFVQDRREVKVRVLNAMHRERKLMRGSPLTCCEPVMMVTPPYVEQPQCKEPTSEGMESGAEHQEGPKEDAVVKPIGGLRKQHRDWNLAAEHSGQPEERTWRNCGACKELATTSRKMTRHAAVARRKRNVFRKIWTQGNCGPRNELATAGRRMTHSTKVAWHRGHDRKRYDQDIVVQETWKGRTFKKRRWKGPMA